MIVFVKMDMSLHAHRSSHGVPERSYVFFVGDCLRSQGAATACIALSRRSYCADGDNGNGKSAMISVTAQYSRSVVV